VTQENGREERELRRRLSVLEGRGPRLKRKERRTADSTHLYHEEGDSLGKRRKREKEEPRIPFLPAQYILGRSRRNGKTLLEGIREGGGRVRCKPTCFFHLYLRQREEKSIGGKRKGGGAYFTSSSLQREAKWKERKKHFPSTQGGKRERVCQAEEERRVSQVYILTYKGKEERKRGGERGGGGSSARLYLS